MYSAYVKDSEMPIPDWLPYPPPLYTNIGFELSFSKSDLERHNQSTRPFFRLRTIFLFLQATLQKNDEE